VIATHMTWAALLAAGLVLAACNQGPDPAALPSAGPAGEQGPGYCDAPPADPDALEQWNELCLPDR